MYIVLGATGNVGSNVVAGLRAAGERIICVVHSAEKAAALATETVEAVVVDVADTEALQAVFRRGKRAFLLNPPGDPSGDSNAAELRTARSIGAALVGSWLEKVVLQSTYGAQPGDEIGDLSTLYELEQLVQATGIPSAINRSAYYFTNLDMLLDPAQQGVLPTAFPADFVLPMVAPSDLGRAAVTRLRSALDDVGIAYIEGPQRYSFADVAAGFSQAIKKPVSVQSTPRDQWEQSFRQVGFSDAAARSFARMTAATLDNPELPDDPWLGTTTLNEYVGELARRAT